MLTSPHIANDNSPTVQTAHKKSAYEASVYEKSVSKAQQITSKRADLSNYSPVWQPSPAKPQTASSPSQIDMSDMTDRADKANTAGQSDTMNKAGRASRLPFTAASLFWITSLLANIWAIVSVPANSIHLSIALLAMWSSLFISFLAYKRRRIVLAEMGAMAALLSFALALHIASHRFGIFFSPLIGASLTSFAGLALAFSLNSKLALRLGGLIGAAGFIFAMSANAPDNLSSYLLLGLPPFCLATAYIARRLCDMPSLLLAILTGYFGLAFYLYLASPISLASSTPNIIAPLSLTLIGLAHNRFGKFAQLNDIFGGHIHRLLGWTAGMTGLLAMLMIWQSWGGFAAEPISAAADKSAPSLIINGLLAACVLAIATFEFWRAKLGHQGLPKALIMSALPLLFIYAVLNVNALSLALSSFNPAHLPLAVLILSGIICALGFGQLINGLRQSKALMVLFALLTIGALFAIAGGTIFQSQESAVLGAAALFISGLFALGLTGNAKHRAYAYDAQYA